MAAQIITYFQNRYLLTSLLVVAYSLAIILLHDTFVQLSVVVMNTVSLQSYNEIVRNVFLVIGVALFIFLFIKASKRKDKKVLFVYLIISTILMMLHSLFLFEMNIEIIHSLEFALLAFLLYLVIGRFGAAVVFAIPVMLLDEWMQYIVLYQDYTLYYEFNDIVMDVLGCGFAMIALKIILPETKSISIPSWYKRKEFLFLAALALVFTLLLTTCIISLHKETMCSNTILPLSRVEDRFAFWHVHSFTKASYHILSPVTAVTIISLLCLFFIGLDGYSSTAKTSPSKIV